MINLIPDKDSKAISEEMIVFPINGVGTIGYPHAKKRKIIKICKPKREKQANQQYNWIL